MDADMQDCQAARVCKQSRLCFGERECYFVGAMAGHDLRMEQLTAEAQKRHQQAAHKKAKWNQASLSWDEAA